MRVCIRSHGNKTSSERLSGRVPQRHARSHGCHIPSTNLYLLSALIQSVGVSPELRRTVLAFFLMTGMQCRDNPAMWPPALQS
jgi:hypothetical protein